MAFILARLLGRVVDIQISVEEEVTEFSWNLHNTAQLTDMWMSETMSASVIAAKLGTTRNSVISKANRIGLRKKESGKRPVGLQWTFKGEIRSAGPRKPKKASIPKRKLTTEEALDAMRERRKRKSKPNKGHLTQVFGPMMSGVPKDPRPVREASWKPLPGIEPVSLMDRTGCCWIVTQDSPFLYCNHSVDEGSKLSYCSHHLDMYVSKEKPARIRVKGLV